MYSVIISSVGRYDYLDDLLNSIREQSIKSNDIILILDLNCLNDFNHSALKKKYSDISIYFKNYNLSEKRNFGVIKSKNNIIFFSDDDDIWHPSKSKEILPLLKKYEVVTHNFDKFGKKIEKNCSKLGFHDKQLKEYLLIYGGNIFGGGSSICARKNILTSLKFNSNLLFSEDFDWWIRALIFKKKIFYNSKSLVNYRIHSNNMTKNTLKISRNNILITQKYFFSSIFGPFLFFNSLIRSIIKIFFHSIINLSNQ